MRQFARTTVGVACLLTILAGCGGNGPPPTVTIVDVTCQRADISIIPVVAARRVSPPPGSVYAVDASVTITCNGVPVQGARVSVSYWWATLASAVTDVMGVATFPTESRLGGQMPDNPTVDVTVNPDDGDDFVVPVTVTVTPPPGSP